MSGHRSDAPALAISSSRIMLIAGGLACILALSVAAQTYLSMLGHGHAFGRILLWQLSTWLFWAAVAPFVLRQGAALAARRPRRYADVFHLLGLALLLLLMHVAVAAQFTIWIQPFVPVVHYGYARALVSQLPALFAADAVTFGVLAVAGGALHAHQRARQLELRESRLEAELARAELHALRLEIEPHFLFNTLNAIAALVRMKDNARAVEMLSGLSDFMRANLDRPVEQFALLSSEVAAVKQYIGLQQARFGDRLLVEYRIADACYDLAVPALILQPLVENALRHGLAKQARGGRLTVRAGLDAATGLTLTVADNGAGLAAGFDPAAHAGTGLRNIRSRLEHLYGARASFDIRTADGGGTIVEIRMPAEAAERLARATA